MEMHSASQANESFGELEGPSNFIAELTRRQAIHQTYMKFEAMFQSHPDKERLTEFSPEYFDPQSVYFKELRTQEDLDRALEIYEDVRLFHVNDTDIARALTDIPGSSKVEWWNSQPSPLVMKEIVAAIKNNVADDKVCFEGLQKGWIRKHNDCWSDLEGPAFKTQRKQPETELIEESYDHYPVPFWTQYRGEVAKRLKLANPLTLKMNKRLVEAFLVILVATITLIVGVGTAALAASVGLNRFTQVVTAITLQLTVFWFLLLPLGIVFNNRFVRKESV